MTFMSVSSKSLNAFHSNFHITHCDHLETFCSKDKFIWWSVEPLTKQRTQVPLKSSHNINSLRVRQNLEFLSTFKHHWANSIDVMLASCMHCFYDHSHLSVTYSDVTKYRSWACMKTQIIHFWSSIFIINRIEQIWFFFRHHKHFNIN